MTPSRQSLDSRPTAARLPIEVRLNWVKAAFGAVSCLVFAVGAGVWFVAMITLATEVSIGQVLGQCALAAVFLFVSLYGLSYYLRRLVDRSVKVLFEERGVSLFIDAIEFYPWSEIADVWVSGKRLNGTVETASLFLKLRSGKHVVKNVEGLDEAPEYLVARVEERLPPRKK